MEEGKQALRVGVMACGGGAEVGVALRSTRVCSITTLQLVRAVLFSLLSPLRAGRVHKNCCLLRWE